MKNWHVFAHTADVGLRVWGKTRRELFKNAALGMVSLLLEVPPARPSGRGSPKAADGVRKTSVRLRSRDAESLLVDWLHEILFLAAVKNKALVSAAFKKLDARSLQAVVTLSDVEKDCFLREIKAVTRHRLAIKKTASGFRTDVIFDI